MKKDAQLEMLRSVPLLQGLSKREIRSIFAAGKELEFRAGTAIVEEGLLGRDLYLILTGQAKVTVGGRKRAMLGPGDYFGEIAVLDGGRRTASVVAETRVWAWRIERTQFLPILQTHAGIAYKIMQEMCRRVREARPALTH